MGLVSSLNNAISGLNVNQQNLNILSQNIANANTPDYSTQVANQQASFINGLPQGVTIASITRKVNEFLTAQVRTQTSLSGNADVIQNYYQQVVNLLGQPGGTNSMDQNVNALFSALQNMANVPSASAQTSVVNAASTLAAQISGLAGSVQDMRLQADSEIGNSVSSVNVLLRKLHTLNASLEYANATKANPSGLLDQRDAALRDLSQYMDITTLFNIDGSVNVNTTSGATLVGSNLTQLSYLPASSVQAFNTSSSLGALQVITYDDQGKAIGNPVTLVTGGVSGTNGSDSTITSNITGGKIAGYVAVRDQVLPSILSQLDSFASTLRNQMNAINNAGASFPTASTYTGERLVRGTEVSTYTGSIRIALLGTDGAPVASPYPDEPYGMTPLTLDLSTLDTGAGAGNVSTDGLINAINEYFKQPQPKLELGNINNVQLAVSSDSIPGPGNQVNFDFSLNNIGDLSANFFVSDLTVLDSNGAPAGTGSTLNVPQVALNGTNTFTTALNSTIVTVNVANGSSIRVGDMVYLPPASPAGAVGGIPTSQMSGYFKVESVSGNSFTIDVGATANSNASYNATGAVYTNYATVEAGTTSRTGKNGLITADLSSNPTSPFYTVQATVATVDAEGNIKTSVVTYTVSAATAGARNDLYGASSQTGDGTVVRPTNSGSQMTVSLVDANGNALQKTNGIYGNKTGYLKFTSASASQSIVIDSMDSKQVGTPISTGTASGTNQGFSQYFGLNNFFKTNSLTGTGDTLAGSALNFAVTSRISSNPTLISIGKLTQSNQSADPDARTNYTWRMNAGDNSISQQLAGLASSSVQFAAAGGLPGLGTTISQYAGLVIAQTSTNLNNASNTQQDRQTLLNGFTTQAQNTSGVNLDQELANTVVFQNAYTASTRIITVVSQLFQDLLGVIR